MEPWTGMWRSLVADAASSDAGVFYGAVLCQTCTGMPGRWDCSPHVSRHLALLPSTGAAWPVSDAICASNQAQSAGVHSG